MCGFYVDQNRHPPPPPQPADGLLRTAAAMAAASGSGSDAGSRPVLGAALAPQPTRRRLHVSGLSPAQCSLADVHARFAAFGLTVTSVDNWPPKQNAVGLPTDWCFLTVHGDEATIRRAMGVLHGTMWKGAKLRVGKAKPDQSARAVDRAGVGEAQQQRSDIKAERAAQKEQRKHERTRRRRGVQGVQADDIDTVVTPANVDEGLWGWKKTPAGHLLRPLHMRPGRPLPTPTKGGPVAKEAVHSTENGVEKPASKTKKPKINGRPLARAKRVTIDPSRYHGVHLSGTMLDGGVEPIDGAEWHCHTDDESEGMGVALWSLIGKDGTVHKQERLQKRRAETDSSGTATQADSPNARDDDSGSANGATPSSKEMDPFDEVDAAIDQARSDDSDSEAGETDVEGKREHNQQIDMHDQDVAHAATTDAIVYPEYDPDNESTYSDGYQEHQHEAGSAPGVTDSAAEKAGQLDILKSMFGARGTKTETSRAPPAVDINPEPVNLHSSTGEDDVGEDPEEAQDVSMREAMPSKLPSESGDDSSLPAAAQPASSTAAARRAALLGVLQSNSTTQQRPGQFQPIVRFDPGTAADTDGEDGEDDNDADGAGALATGTHATTADRPAREEGHVQMTTLTDMFRPKRDTGAGFSLLDALDLDLDEDLDFGYADAEDDERPRHAPGTAGALSERDAVEADAGQAATALPTRAAGLPRLFPSVLDAHGHPRPTDPSVFGAVLQRLQQEDIARDNSFQHAAAVAHDRDPMSLVAAFFQPDDAATLARKWEARKATLTQAYKRRHREALKKKRRRFTGARAAGGGGGGGGGAVLGSRV